MGIAGELGELAKLKEDGVLTDEEFAEQKARVLAGGGSAPEPASPPPPPAGTYPPPGVAQAKDRTTAALLGIFLGAFGAHKFYLGYQNAAIIHLVVCLAGAVFFFLGPLAISTIGFVEGVIYLSKSDEEFQQSYVLNRKEWF
jgi:TM2 domain-containing membrane protein YozV